MAQFTRENISFKTIDGVTLRGWFYKPTNQVVAKWPCLVMSNGFSALKEGIDPFAEYFTTHLPLSCLVFDNRGFGDSDAKEGMVRQEINPAEQTSDISDAVTFVQLRVDVDPDRVGIWGSSFSGGNVLWVGAVDRRVKVVLSQVPLVDGWQNYHWLLKGDLTKERDRAFQEGPSNLLTSVPF
jgi:cephalosporin-C deacetylase-like acetyl esterase